MSLYSYNDDSFTPSKGTMDKDSNKTYKLHVTILIMSKTFEMIALSAMTSPVID